MMDLVLATRNAGKITEMREALAGLPWRIRSVEEFPDVPEVDEDGKTLEENARKKARVVGAAVAGWALADDTGLEVAALEGAPGVFSARYAGVDASYDDNNAKLLQALKGESDRRAKFRCVLALADPEGKIVLEEGMLAGSILEARRGDGGFGYDPIFAPEGSEKSLAQLSTAEKNKISHRGKAVLAMAARLRSLAPRKP